MNASNAPRQTRRARLKIIFLNFQFQTRASGSVRLVSVNRTLPSGSDQVRFGWKIPDSVGA